VLGMISSAPYAATTKHKAHHKAQEMQTQATVAPAQGYKGEGIQPIALETCPRSDMYTLLMTRLSQNVGRAVTTVGCDSPIAFAGGINFDAMVGNRSIGYQGMNLARLALNDAYLNVFGNVNEFTTAFMSFSYNDTNDRLVDAWNTRGQRPGIYSSATPNGLTLEQGFITVRDWNTFPAFVQLGKQYQPFGRYSIHPVVRSMDQVLSETLRTSAEVGFIVPMGIHGTAYVFDNTMFPRSASTGIVLGHTQPNGGAELGYDVISDQLGWDVGIGWMYDMVGVNDVAYAVGLYNTTPGANFSGTGNYANRVSAGSLYADVNSGPFSVSLRYVTALQRFNIADLGNNATGITASTHGAKPWAVGLTGGYGFNVWNKNQSVYIGYQGSGDAVNMLLPKTRWLAGYDMEVAKNLTAGLQYNYNKDYSTGAGATGAGSSDLYLRVAVKFG